MAGNGAANGATNGGAPKEKKRVLTKNEKKRLKKANALINLPYVIEGPTAADPTETVVTQSNSCLLYLGQRLGIDR